jgi:hypothetical protein
MHFFGKRISARAVIFITVRRPMLVHNAKLKIANDWHRQKQNSAMFAMCTPAQGLNIWISGTGQNTT